MDLFWRYIRQKGDLIEEAIATSKDTGVVAKATTAITDERRGSATSLISSGVSESGIFFDLQSSVVLV